MRQDDIIRGKYNLDTPLGRSLHALRMLFNAYMERRDVAAARSVAWDAYQLTRREGDGNCGCLQWLTTHQVLAVLCVD